MNIIFPIKEEGIYQFDFELTNDPKIMFPIMDLIKKGTSPEFLRRFIKRNNDHKSLSILLSMIPFNDLLQWYYENQIMRCYWSKELLMRLYHISFQKLKIKFYNDEYYENELISLTNKFNSCYNFTTKIVNNRILMFRNKYSIKLGDFYGGQQLVEFLGSNKLFKKVYNDEIVYKIKLYPKIERIMREYSETKFNPNLIIEDRNIIFEIVLEQFNNIGSIIIDFNENAIVEFHELYANFICKPDYYNNLSNNVDENIDYGDIINEASNTLSKIYVKKQGSIKLKKHECSLREITSCESVARCYVC